MRSDIITSSQLCPNFYFYKQNYLMYASYWEQKEKVKIKFEKLSSFLEESKGYDD